MIKKKFLKFIGMLTAIIIAMMFTLSACATPEEAAERAGGGDTATNALPTERRAVDRDNAADYFNATLEHTLQQLEFELMSLADNRVFSQIGEIFSTGEFNLELLLNVNSFMSDLGFGAMPVITSNLSSSLRNRVLALTIGVEDMFDVPIFLHDTAIFLNDYNFIVSLLGENFSISTDNFLDDLMTFSRNNGLGLEHEIDLQMFEELGIENFSYSSLFIPQGSNTALADRINAMRDTSIFTERTQRRLEAVSDGLYSGATFTIEDTTVNSRHIHGEVTVTTVTISADAMNTAMVDAVEILLEDEIFRNFFETIMGGPFMTAVILQELSNIYQEDIVIQYVERNGRYIAMIFESDYGKLEIGAIGEEHMLDHFYISFDDGRDDFLFSIVGNNVNTDQFSSEITIEGTGFETIRFNFSWDTTRPSDNFVLNLYEFGSISGTFAVDSNNDVVFALSTINLTGIIGLTFAENDFRLTLSELARTINVPTDLSPLRDMTMRDLERIMLTLMLAFY